MITMVLIIIACVVFSLIVGLYCGFCLAAKIYARESSELWELNNKQFDQIDRFISIAEDQNEVLNRFVNTLDDLKRLKNSKKIQNKKTK